MHLPRHTIESHAPTPLFTNAAFSSYQASTSHTPYSPSAAPTNLAATASNDTLSDPSLFACATPSGFIVAQSDPLKVVTRKNWPSSQGGLSYVAPVQHSSLLFLVGGGRVPRFAPNKVVLWDEAAEFYPDQQGNDDLGSGRAPSFEDDKGQRESPSRQASTIFSAGSKFGSIMASSVAPSDMQEQVQSPTKVEKWVLQSSSPVSASPPDSLRFSHSSLVDFKEQEGQTKAFSGSPNPEQLTESTYSEMVESFGASSLGIGRMQRSSLEHSLPQGHEEEGGMSSSSTISVQQQGMPASSASIIASSADLDDPFTFDEPKSRSPSPTSFSSLHHDSAGHPSTEWTPEAFTASLSSKVPQSIAASKSEASSLAASAISVTSLGSSVTSQSRRGTDTPKTRARQPIKGREVAELEFGEMVRGIRVASVPGRADKAATGTSPSSVILVVLLTFKTIIFELMEQPVIEHAELEWSITKRVTVSTYKNPNGLGAVAPYSAGSAIIAVPGKQKGHVQIIRLKMDRKDGDKAVGKKLSTGASTIIVAHESSVASIALSPCGRLLGTASNKGTLIRIWSTIVGSEMPTSPSNLSPHGAKVKAAGRTGFGAMLVRELRRGTDPARILSTAFAPDGSAIATASDKGTVHIFRLDDLVDSSSRPAAEQGHKRTSSTNLTGTAPFGAGGGSSGPTSGNKSTSFGSTAAKLLPTGLGQLASAIPLSMLPQYFKSEWSSAQFRVPLQTFGADSRASQTSAFFGGDETVSKGDASHYQQASSDARREGFRNLGTEKSTDGAWAAMKGRLDDIRKGEPGVDEKVFLCWISTREQEKSAPLASDGSDEEVRRQERAGFRLIVLSTSGAWYKLALTQSSSGNSSGQADEGAGSTDEEAGTGSTVLDMYRQDAMRDAKGKNWEKNAMGCQLEEYRQFSESTDGWEF